MIVIIIITRGGGCTSEFRTKCRLLKSVLWCFIYINPKFSIKSPRLLNNYTRLFCLWIGVLSNTLRITRDRNNNYNSIDHIFFLINIKNLFFYCNIVRMQKVLIIFVLMTFLYEEFFIRFIRVYSVDESNRLKEKTNDTLKN